MTKIKFCLLTGLALASMAIEPVAPASATTLPDGTVIAGIWKITANTSTMLLQIESQGGDGSGCTHIIGYLYPTTGANQWNTDSVKGYFCLPIGQITFLRNDAVTLVTKQVFDGNLGGSSIITGSFASFGGGDASGEFGVFGKFWSN
jgi:hypothetical protein